MVVNPWPDGEGFASIAATHARQACSAPRRRLPWKPSEVPTAPCPTSCAGADRTTTVPRRPARLPQNASRPPAARENPYTAYHDFDLPAYVGSTSFQKLPVLTNAAALR